MNEKEIIIKLMEEQNLRIADLANMMGISNAALWDRIKSPKNKSLTTQKLNEILSNLNYEIVLMPRAKAGKINGAYVVTTEGGGKK
jgi:DNA-binding Xre family transcriptional regulator